MQTFHAEDLVKHQMTRSSKPCQPHALIIRPLQIKIVQTSRRPHANLVQTFCDLLKCKPRADLVQTLCKPHADPCKPHADLMMQTSCKMQTSNADLVQTSCNCRPRLCERAAEPDTQTSANP